MRHYCQQRALTDLEWAEQRRAQNRERNARQYARRVAEAAVYRELQELGLLP